MKFIIVTGGVCSGVGKGIVTSSIGALLKGCGLKVCAIKIDPYVNPDAGLMSPREHGEVFVMDDGGEVDLDLGNYERYLDTTMSKRNNLTTGKVFSGVIEAERRGEYLGKTVRVIPDVTNYIKKWIRSTASEANADVCLIELGGTIGDIEGVNFIEALRLLQFEEGQTNVVIIQVDHLIELFGTREIKTKPVQVAIKNSRQSGLNPNLLVCRTQYEIDNDSRRKISESAGIPSDRILNLIQLESVYKVPSYLHGHSILKHLSEMLQLNDLKLSDNSLRMWNRISDLAVNAKTTIHIGLVGKYVQWPDTYTSVTKALEHACYYIEAKPQTHMIDSEKLKIFDDNNDAWRELKSCSCLIVPGGFDHRGTSGIINSIRWARENKVPYLGICLGFQLAVIEHARNVLNMPLADSQEFNAKADLSSLVIIEMLDYKDPLEKLGGTMRLGLKKATFVKQSFVRDLYERVNGSANGSGEIYERHRHRYEVNPDLAVHLERDGLSFVAKNDDGLRMEILELDLKSHPYFVGVQFHPEYLSRPFRPSPPFLGLVEEGKKRTGTND